MEPVRNTRLAYEARQVPGEGVRGKTAADAARWYLTRHKALSASVWAAGAQVREREPARVEQRPGGQLPPGLLRLGNQVRAAWSRWVSPGHGAKRLEGDPVSSSLTRDRSLIGKGAKLSAVRSLGCGGSRGAQPVGGERPQPQERSGLDATGRRRPSRQAVGQAVAFPTVRSGVRAGVRGRSSWMRSVKPLAAGLRSRGDRPDSRARRTSSKTWRRARPPPGGPDVHVQRQVPATDGACDVQQGPFTVGAGIRALDGFSAATVPTNDLVLCCSRTACWSSRRTRCSRRAVPLRARGRRAPGHSPCRPATSTTQGLRPSGPERAWLGCSTDLHGHVHDRRLASATGVPRAVEGVPDVPPLYTLNQDPVEPAEHGHTRGVVLDRRSRLRQVAGGTSPHAGRGITTTS